MVKSVEALGTGVLGGYLISHNKDYLFRSWYYAFHDST